MIQSVAAAPFGGTVATPGFEGEAPRPFARCEAKGKFLVAGGARLQLRGVTYGTLRPDATGNEFGDRARARGDLALISGHGFNALRTYTPPPIWFLDEAAERGLRVMIGLPWEQHISFLSERRTQSAIRRRLEAMVADLRGHPAILCLAIGNEIPAPVVRWHGRRAVERFLDRLCRTVKEKDPGALVTYVNYPSTEYLEVPACDLVAFNVFLETQSDFRAYLARLQSLAGDRPLVMSEVGLDSRRNGLELQAETVAWQVRTTVAAGCAGAFVFAWTDEWHRGGHEVEDWDFGLTTRDRFPKPALAAACEAFAASPLPEPADLPRVSVVVCTHNGAKTLSECLAGLTRLAYPNLEVIVVNDGSTDESGRVAEQFEVRLIHTPNHGLSAARNAGLNAASGDIIAYIDDDAFPDSAWLDHLVLTLLTSSHVGVGGPNIPPSNDGFVADCVSHAPGGPVHVLLSDQVAEHVPGCNMAFWKSSLEAVGGFDPQFRTAGDDVDICWRLQERGWTIGFSPAAMVWHHRRNSVGAFLRQQNGYGKSEALLERKWPEKYNTAGHVTWAGRIYGRMGAELFSRSRIYHGVWGRAPFQALYQDSPLSFLAVRSLPEWWLVILGLAVLTLLGSIWHPLLWSGLLLTVALGIMVAESVYLAHKACARTRPKNGARRAAQLLVVTVLHLIQPLARLNGRWRHGLTVWRNSGPAPLAFPRTRISSVWTEQWRDPLDHLRHFEQQLRRLRMVTLKGGAYDRWDLEIRGGLLGAARAFALVEEHGSGCQLLKFKTWPVLRLTAVVPVLLFGTLASAAWIDHSAGVSFILALATTAIVVRTARECAAAQSAADEAVLKLPDSMASPTPGSTAAESLPAAMNAASC
jgi:glycosyltransferase involved in cell wall biosynthesis